MVLELIGKMFKIFMQKGKGTKIKINKTLSNILKKILKYNMKVFKYIKSIL